MLVPCEALAVGQYNIGLLSAFAVPGEEMCWRDVADGVGVLVWCDKRLVEKMEKGIRR